MGTIDFLLLLVAVIAGVLLIGYIVNAYNRNPFGKPCIEISIDISRRRATSCDEYLDEWINSHHMQYKTLKKLTRRPSFFLSAVVSMRLLLTHIPPIAGFGFLPRVRAAIAGKRESLCQRIWFICPSLTSGPPRKATTPEGTSCIKGPAFTPSLR